MMSIIDVGTDRTRPGDSCALLMGLVLHSCDHHSGGIRKTEIHKNVYTDVSLDIMMSNYGRLRGPYKAGRRLRFAAGSWCFTGVTSAWRYAIDRYIQ